MTYISSINKKGGQDDGTDLLYKNNNCQTFHCNGCVIYELNDDVSSKNDLWAETLYHHRLLV